MIMGTRAHLYLSLMVLKLTTIVEEIVTKFSNDPEGGAAVGSAFFERRDSFLFRRHYLLYYTHTIRL